jgi:hypothetical protein
MSGIWNAFSVDQDGAAATLQNAHKQYRVAKRNATVWRDKFMMTLAEATSTSLTMSL